MRAFYDFGPDSRQLGLEYVCRYDADEFDTSALIRCRPLDDGVPAEVRMWVERGGRTDFLANPEGWPILSDRLIELIQGIAAADVQALPFPLIYAGCQEPVNGYGLVNVLRSLSGAVDLEKSVTSEMVILGKRIQNVITPVFRSKNIPLDAHIFRPHESPYRIVISGDLAQAMIAARVVGVALIRATTV
jgi:hypothetical protein